MFKIYLYISFFQLSSGSKLMDLWIGKENNEICSDINMNMLSCKDKKHVFCGFSGRVFLRNGHSLCNIFFIE